MRPWYRFCRFFCHAAFLLFFRGRVFGSRRVPLTGGVVLVCNHQSFLDPVLATLALQRECHYMARDTLFKNGRFRWLIESLNAFPIKRGTADIGSIKETLRRLKAGALITVFPEGTRSPDGSVLPMQSGVVLIARKAGVPMIPTLILGAFEAWPRHAKLPRPRPVIVAYGEPLTAEQIKSMDEKECVAELRRRIIEMMREYAKHPSVRGTIAAAEFDGHATTVVLDST
ncbi:MAG: lysophospholipid acyltransferase family protein [Phycisphaerae bacterium]